MFQVVVEFTNFPLVRKLTYVNSFNKNTFYIKQILLCFKHIKISLVLLCKFLNISFVSFAIY